MRTSEHIEPQGETAELRNALLRHMDSLHAVAQAITLDEHRAARLVEATYRRAFEEAAGGHTPANPKLWLLELLLAYGREGSGVAAVGPGGVELHPDLPEPPHSLQQRIAGQVMRRTLPVALTVLPQDLRTVLLLIHVEDVPYDRAGEMLGVDVGTVTALLKAAEARLVEALRAACSALEWQLLEKALPEDWMPNQLAQVVQHDFPTAPPMLRRHVEEESGKLMPGARPPALQARALKSRLEHARSRKSAAAQGIVIAFLLIVATGVLGLLVSRLAEEEIEMDLITLMARDSDEAAAILRTDSPEQAEQFVRDRLGFRLTLPDIEQAQLTGVGVAELAPEVEAPFFTYTDSGTDDALVVYAYTYAMLDRFRDRVTLEADILNQIARDEHFDLHDLGREKVLIWRNRDDIFVAITHGNAEALRERILPAS